MKVAIVYDRVNKWGGAERVLLALHDMFPDAPLYTSVYDAKKASWAKVFPEIHTSILQKIPFAKGNHELLGVFMPLIFEAFDLSGYDLVVSVTSESAKGVITGPNTIHICYLLTPTRYLWSHYEEYFANPILRLISLPAVRYLRKWDRLAASRPDYIFAISGEISARVRKFYGRKAFLVHPPSTLKGKMTKKPKKADSYLLVSRLVKYKKVDLAIRAFNILGKKLVIAGTGREEKNLRKIAGKNIRFTGHLKDSDLIKLYQTSRALVMPQHEDFGLVSIEAQSFGLPVVAFGKGGARDTVIHGKTGVLFGNQTADSLIYAVRLFEDVFYNLSEREIINNSLKFSEKEFKQKMKLLMKKILK
jgi:glycosyltransferase involved in cell wall biosynthesis